MYCRYCGKEVSDIAVVCTGCGVPKGAGNKFCYNCGSDTPEIAVICVKCGCALGNNPYGQGNNVNGQGIQYYNPAEQKSKIAAGLLGIFLGYLGIHNFYLGFTNRAIIQIVVSVVTCGVGGIWGFVEGILILVGNINVDAKGIPLKD
jgi:TM2 domain-containing membrane protein YozV